MHLITRSAQRTTDRMSVMACIQLCSVMCAGGCPHVFQKPLTPITLPPVMRSHRFQTSQITNGLMFVMLGMGLTLTFDDIGNVFTKQPVLLALGMVRHLSDLIDHDDICHAGLGGNGARYAYRCRTTWGAQWFEWLRHSRGTAH